MHTFPAFTELLFFECQKCKQPMAGSAVSAATEEIKGTAAVHGSKYRSGLRTASSGESAVLAEIEDDEILTKKGNIQNRDCH